MIDANHVWGPDRTRQGADAKALRLLETELSRNLPQALKDLLLEQDGGLIADEMLVFFGTNPHAEDVPHIAPLNDLYADDEILREELEEAGINPDSVIMIGGSEDGHAVIGLHYKSTTNPKSLTDPEVVWIDEESLDIEVLADSFGEYLESLLAVDETPCFDVDQVDTFPIVAESRLELSNGQDEGFLEQKLFETETTYMLYIHEKSGLSEQKTLCEMQKPIEPDSCTISSLRPDPQPTFQLSFSPQIPEDSDLEDDRILWINARRTSRGWKNAKSLGVPLSASFEHEDRKFLEDLRRSLLGGEPSPLALAEEQWQARMDEISDEEMEGLFPHMMMQMLQQSEQMVKDLDLGEPPPEIKDAFEHLSQLKAKIQQDISAKGETGTEIPADLLELMNQVIGRPDEDEQRQ